MAHIRECAAHVRMLVLEDANRHAVNLVWMHVQEGVAIHVLRAAPQFVEHLVCIHAHTHVQILVMVLVKVILKWKK